VSQYFYLKISYKIDRLMAKIIDSSKAREIARNFLAQNHAVIGVREPILEDHTWIVEADVMLFSTHHIKKVKVDAQTGRILGCQSYYLNPRTESL